MSIEEAMQMGVPGREPEDFRTCGYCANWEPCGYRGMGVCRLTLERNTAWMKPLKAAAGAVTHEDDDGCGEWIEYV